MNKTIILIIPHHFEIYKAFVDNLEKLGFHIKLLYLSGSDFAYKNIGQRITNFFRKTFLGDKTYKQNLKDNFDSILLNQALSKIDKIVDYTLVIRPDYFSPKAIKNLKKKTKNLIAYQWDGLDRYAGAKELISLFDRFFLFDIDDYKKYKKIFPNVFFTSNFYFEVHKTAKLPNKKKKVFFIGSFIESRMDEIIYLTKIFSDLNLELDVNLLYFNNNTPLKYQNSDINFINENITYLEVLEKIRDADIILDFIDTIHGGLSLRTFEALNFSKKLITNNKIVMDYDFYNIDNILVWNQQIDKDLIENFISVDYVKIDEKIVNKYSFSNWIKNILNVDER